MLIKKELNSLNNKIHKNNAKYFKHNLPFSVFNNIEEDNINGLIYYHNVLEEDLKEEIIKIVLKDLEKGEIIDDGK